MTHAVVTDEAMLCDGILRPGNTNCAGCGMSLGHQWVEQAQIGRAHV